MKRPCVYMVANGRNGSLYVGVTSDLVGRVWRHKTKAVEGFTSKNSNPQWRDSYDEIVK